jgi:hypothetical protein
LILTAIKLIISIPNVSKIRYVVCRFIALLKKIGLFAEVLLVNTAVRQA